MSSSSTTTPPQQPPHLYHHTPLLESLPLSTTHSRPIYLKLDSLQPSGSFKDRGMSNLCTTLQKNQNVTHFISSSGGNAGHSASYVGRRLNVPVTVIVPKTTKPLMLEKIRRQGATVRVYGENWNEADGEARRLVEESETGEEEGGKAAYISPYEHELLWEGHGSLVSEIVEDLGGRLPGAIIVSVGGGGLICGVLGGLTKALGGGDVQKKVAVVAAETKGAESFHRAWEEKAIVSLDSIDSIATSLGALSVSPTALKRAMEHVDEGRGDVMSVVVEDKEAVKACDFLAEEHRLLVEPACGAALAALDKMDMGALEDGAPVVVVVCGGSAITPAILQEYKDKFL